MEGKSEVQEGKFMKNILVKLRDISLVKQVGSGGQKILKSFDHKNIMSSLKDSSVKLVLSGGSFFLKTDFFLEKVSNNFEDSVERASVIEFLEEMHDIEYELITVIGDGKEVFTSQGEIAETLAQ